MRPSPEPAQGAAALLLQALGGRALRVEPLPPARPDAPPPRPILTATHLLLPAAGSEALQRAAVAHAAAHLLHSTPAQPAGTLKPLGLAVVSAVEDARVEQLLMQALPGVGAWFLAGLRASVEPHGLSAAALLSRLSLALHDEDYRDGNHWVDKGRTLFARLRREQGLGDAAAYRRLASVLANDLGQMRVQFHPRQYAVPGAYRDDNSYLWDHGTAPEAEGEPLTVHAPATAAPAGDGAPAPPPAPLLHSYPEWDYRRGIERRDWCTVHEQAPPDGPGAAAATGTLPPPPLHWRRLDRSQRQRRQWEGETLDLDAAVEAQVHRRLRLAPEGRLFLRAVPAPRRISLLVLLDLSLSTAARAQPEVPSLLEVERDAALLLARTAQAAGDRIAIHGFCSDTRARVHYHPLLDFGATLDARAVARLRSVDARYSTRLGAGLRHAAHRLRAEHADLRALVVLTDGAPADIDVHDPRHLVEDARAAVQAAARQGLQVWGVAVDPGAADYARRIFGPRRQQVLATPGQLPRLLGRLYTRLAQG